MAQHEYNFNFASEQQHALYEQFREELRALPWETIRRTVRECGAYRLGLTRDLQPIHPVDPSLAGVSPQDLQTAWFFALIQVTLLEASLALAHRPDANTGQDTLWITAQPAVAWRTGTHRLKRSAESVRRQR